MILGLYALTHQRTLQLLTYYLLHDNNIFNYIIYLIFKEFENLSVEKDFNYFLLKFS